MIAPIWRNRIPFLRRLFKLKKTLVLLGYFFFVGCTSKQQDTSNQKKLAPFFAKSTDVALDKATRLQYLDSAQLFLQTVQGTDSAKINNYFKVANQYFMLLEYEKYKAVTQSILSLSQSIKDSLNTAKAEYYLGDYYLTVSKNDSAFYYYSAAEKKYNKIDDKLSLANTKLHKAYILAYEKDFVGSEIETIKVLSIAKELGDELLVFECYTSLGSALSSLGNYENGLTYHQKALEQIKKIEALNYKPILQGQTLNNIGFVYLSSKHYKEARQVFEEGLKIKNLKEIQPVIYTTLLDNFAYSRFKINKKEGLDDFKTALTIRNEIEDVYGKINSYIHLTEYYLSQKDTLKALELNKVANQLAKQAHYNKELLITLDFFTKLLPKQGLAYAKKHIQLNDSLQHQERATRNKLARIAFETDEIITEKELLSNQINFFLRVTGLVFLFSLLFFIIFYQRNKHKELVFKQQQQEANEEIYALMLNNQEEIDEARRKIKRNIALELHDNILNKLISTRLNLFAITKKQDKETLKKAIEQVDFIQEIENEIRTFSHELHKNSDLQKSNFMNILEEFIKIQKETFPPECLCTLLFDEAINNTKPEIKMNIYRIIQEAFNNINKYAKASKIEFIFKAEQGFLCLEIIDNGVGFNVRKTKNGIGIKNMMDRAQTINGIFLITSKPNSGTRIKLNVPI